MAIKYPTILNLITVTALKAQGQSIKKNTKEIEFAVLYENAFGDLVPFLQYLFIIGSCALVIPFKLYFI